MPIAGGILVAGSAARCLSSAAGMLRFLARLSGRRRHVRRSCGPGGGCCVAAGRVNAEETRTATTTTTTATTTTTTATTTTTTTPRTMTTAAATTTTTTTTAGASVTREFIAGGTTTMTSVHQDRRKDCCDEEINRIEDPSWIEKNFVSHDNTRIINDKDSRFTINSDNHNERNHVNSHNRQERTRNCYDNEQQEVKTHPHLRECSRLNGEEEFFEIRQNNDRLSIDDIDNCHIHRVEEIHENQRFTRRQRLQRTSRCRSTSTRKSENLEDWRTSEDYVDLIVRGHHPHHHDNRERGTTEQRTDSSNSNFCNSSTRRSRIPPYLATLLIISYTLFGIADACSSRSTPKPRPPTVTSRPNITFHMYTCPPDYAEWYCLNGATCFTVKIQESLLYNCICSDGFIGQRCEFKDLDGSYLPSRQRVMLETASIAGGATIAVFLVVIICIAAYIHCKRKQKELRTSSTCVDTVDGPGRDPELRPFSNRSLMIFMAKNPNGSTMCPSIEQTRMPGWNDYSQMESARMASVNEGKRGSSH